VQPSMYSLYNHNGYAPSAVKDVQSGVNLAYYGKGHNSTFPDIWDPNFYAWLDGTLRNDASLKPAQNSPWVVGWVSDECDALNGLCGPGPEMATNPPGYNQRHQALMALVTSPVQNANPGRAMVGKPQVYANQEVATKTQLKAFLQKRYSSLEALNTAWGSNYTQWDSTGMQTIAEPLGVGDGSTATFRKTLSNKDISPLSVAVKVSGVKVGGDCPRWLCTAAATGHGGFTGLSAGADVTVSAGDIDYAKGVLTITFNRAPVRGDAITIDYIRDGWGYGAGLMDEDGRHAWIPTDKVHLGSNVAFNNDMNEFLRELATQYFSVTRERIKHYSPHSLYFGPGVLGTWGGVGNRNVLQAAATYVDVLTWQPDYRRLQSELDYVATHAGDKPIILWHGAKATADSAMWRYANPVSTQCDPCNTQEERGRFYADSMNVFVNTRNTVYNTRTIIGMRWWEFHDNWVEGNWGVVSLHDNAYDGVEACQGSHKTSLGVVTYAEESIPGWQPNHAYSVPNATPRAGSRIQVVVNGTRYTYEVVRPGVSGNSQPPWPPREGAFAGDGSVVWKNVGVKTSQFCYGDFLTPVMEANSLWLAK
ncbi:MAG TPA: hypothetical protein VN428_08435, partial [Bryobacteraceae bacterium]|nr:hypothetical protein [Bryobacteraceae bacterium]